MKLPLFALFCALCSLGFAETSTPAPRPMHVALVIDDGPVPVKSPALVKLLKEKDVKATFSYIAAVLEKNPADGRAAVAAGFEINNHSFNHRHPNELNAQELEHEVADAQTVIQSTLGVTPRFYWQPFAELNDTVVSLTRKHGLQLVTVGHVVPSLDFIPQLPGEQLFKNATSNIQDGTIINFHEWPDETLAQMPAIIDELRRQGCVFVTLSELVDYLGQKKAE